MRSLIAIMIWGGAIAACGGEVYVMEDDGKMVRVEDDGGSSESSGGGDKDCASCNNGDCGLCMLEAGNDVYRCIGDRPPDVGRVCSQTGSIFHDGNGGSYVCWRCDL